MLRTLSAASREALQQSLDSFPDRPAFEIVRKPETGLVMLQGRIGGSGAPFNLGEVTVTRSAVALQSGELGYGHVLGRDADKAVLVASFDALWQSPQYRKEVEARLFRPLREAEAEGDRLIRERTEATRVNFFTIVRGEDA